MRLRAISAPSSGASGSRPSMRPSMVSSTAATAMARAWGIRTRGGAAAAEPGQQPQDLAQGHVLVAQDVAAAGPPALQREAVAGGDVADVNQVEAGVNVGGHAAGQEVGDDAARRGGGVVARPDGRGRVDHHDVLALARGGQGEALGARPSSACRRRSPGAGGSGVSSSPGAPSGREADRGHGRAVDHRHALARRGGEDVARAVRRWCGSPRRPGGGPASTARPRGTRRRTPRAARAHGAASRRSPGDRLAAGGQPPRAHALRPHQRPDGPAVGAAGRRRRGRPMKPGRAGDERECSPQPPQRLLEARPQRRPAAAGGRAQAHERGQLARVAQEVQDARRPA